MQPREVVYIRQGFTLPSGDFVGVKFWPVGAPTDRISLTDPATAVYEAPIR